MAAVLDLDELVEHFTLSSEELGRLRNKTGATRLAFALSLKHLLWRGRFPRGRAELPDEAVEHVARQVGVSAAEIGLYDWSGRQSSRHRMEIREFLGFRECSVGDADKLTAYLAEHVCQVQRRADQVRVELIDRCRAERIEPSEKSRSDRTVASALHQAEQPLFSRIASRLSPAVTAGSRRWSQERPRPARTRRPMPRRTRGCWLRSRPMRAM